MYPRDQIYERKFCRFCAREQDTIPPLSSREWEDHARLKEQKKHWKRLLETAPAPVPVDCPGLKLVRVS